jgi:hypothetical protein
MGGGGVGGGGGVTGRAGGGLATVGGVGTAAGAGFESAACFASDLVTGGTGRLSWATARVGATAGDGGGGDGSTGAATSGASGSGAGSAGSGSAGVELVSAVLDGSCVRAPLHSRNALHEAQKVASSGFSWPQFVQTITPIPHPACRGAAIIHDARTSLASIMQQAGSRGTGSLDAIAVKGRQSSGLQRPVPASRGNSRLIWPGRRLQVSAPGPRLVRRPPRRRPWRPRRSASPSSRA